MKKDVKDKTLHYRRAQFLKGTGNLQQLLRAALSKMATVDARLESVGGSATNLRCINHHPVQLGMQFGDLLSFERGTNKLLLSTNTNVAALDVAQIAPPPIKGVPSEFLDSILYFGVQGNHVVLLQSNALTSRHFEAHINWLLESANLLKPHARVEFVDSANPDVRRAIEEQPIKRVKFGAPMLDLASSIAQPGKTTHQAHMRFVPEGMGATILKAVLGENAFTKLHLENAIEGNLKVALEVTYDRATSTGGQKALHAIARELRYVDEEDVSVVIPGLGTVKGRDLKLSDTCRVDSYNGLLDQNQVYPAMHEWLRSLLESGMVTS